MNYECLGSNETLRERRYKVLTFYLKGAKPAEIHEGTGLSIKQVYNDIMFLRGAKLHDLHLDIVRDFGKSFMEMKITELERKLKHLETANPPMWIATQKLIREYKNDLLKLSGASIERVEHSGEVAISKIEISTSKREDAD